MNLLIWGEIRPDAAAPDLGPALAEHLRAKSNPAVQAASRSAWNLLAMGLRLLGVNPLPEVRFEPNGKPAFVESPIHFSLSHSGSLAAALISDAPCGVDLERIRPELAHRLMPRCLTGAERESGLNFFQLWTCKECIAKFSGRGMPSHPDALDTLAPEFEGRFFSAELADASGQAYVLSALCEHISDLKCQKMTPDAH